MPIERNRPAQADDVSLPDDDAPVAGVLICAPKTLKSISGNGRL